MLQVHAQTPSEDTQLVDHLKELMEELGPYTEEDEEEEGEEGIEEELERDSEEENDGEEGTSAMDTSWVDPVVDSVSYIIF